MFFKIPLHNLSPFIAQSTVMGFFICMLYNRAIRMLAILWLIGQAAFIQYMDNAHIVMVCRQPIS